MPAGAERQAVAAAAHVIVVHGLPATSKVSMTTHVTAENIPNAKTACPYAIA